MKKLKLKAIEFGDKKMLTREQMKSIVGGQDRPNGYYRCCYYSGCEYLKHQWDGHCTFVMNPPDTCLADGYTYPLDPCTP